MRFHGSTNAAAWRIEVVRDGLNPTTVHREDGLPGRATPMPEGAYERGCDWPVLHSWTLPADLPSGFYLVECDDEDQARRVAAMVPTGNTVEWRKVLPMSED